MDRREFFRKAFAAGIVATVPYSVFTDVGTAVAEIEEEVFMRQLNFGDYKAILAHGETIIAKSHVVNIHMERDLIDVSTHDSPWKEMIPGKMSFDFTMQNVLEDTDTKTLRAVMERSDMLAIYLQDKMSRKYEADCYLTEFAINASKNEPITCDIRLRGSGALIQQDNGI